MIVNVTDDEAVVIDRSFLSVSIRLRGLTFIKGLLMQPYPKFSLVKDRSPWHDMVLSRIDSYGGKKVINGYHTSS